MARIEGETLPTLQATRVSLRWLVDGDAPALYEVFSDPDVTRYWSSPRWIDPKQGIQLIEDVRKLFADGSLYQWGVVLPSEDKVIGTCTLAQIDHTNRRAEIGFALRRDLWGQGLMWDSTRTLLNFAFDALQMNRIEADVDPRNDASIRLLSILGFQREGILRERWIVEGETADTVMYGLLRREWQLTKNRQ